MSILAPITEQCNARLSSDRSTDRRFRRQTFSIGKTRCPTHDVARTNCLFNEMPINEMCLTIDAPREAAPWETTGLHDFI